MIRSRVAGWEWAAVVVVLLLALWARVWQPVTVPPGWRDDELINIHVLTGQVLDGHPTWYFTGASGHEPLYHTLHAATVALVGMNPTGAHLLSVACGVLTVALTIVLARRLFGRSVGLLAAFLLALNFWSLMYSRVGLRHALVLPPALAALYWFWRGEREKRAGWVAGLGLTAALYTYTSSRVVPFILLAFGVYAALFHRARWQGWRRALVLALAVTAVSTVPLWVSIAQGRSEAARLGIGADARISELAVPLHELLAGNPGPLLDTVRGTLGMFHATGDAEWLYNISGRPVFGALGAALFFVGLAACVWRWRRPESALLLVWLAAGLGPALVTLPPASLGHTIVAQPVVMVLVALPLAAVGAFLVRRLPGSRALRLTLAGLVLGAGVCSIAARDLIDYFVVWPQQEMVRFLYRADYRQAAQYLNLHPEVTDVVVGSVLMGPWDRVALADDLRRDDVRVRWVNPERALLLPAGEGGVYVQPAFPQPDPALAELLGPEVPVREGDLAVYSLPSGLPLVGAEAVARFDNGLSLVGVEWVEGEATVWLAWRVEEPLDLPPMPLVANPPPPGVYSGPRLAVFAHLLAPDGTLVAVDDGLWVDPAAVWEGDRFVQVHRFALPADAPAGPYALEVGLYDPRTGERRAVLGADGRVIGDRVVYGE
ncbi:MAG: glycosyltransferase family 39 protein [Anaerolineae bacterium]|nr:glycosyltransferase family 39 protein [Anaerolineae bacterium]